LQEFTSIDGLGVEITAYEGEMMKEGTLASFTYDDYHAFAPYAQ